MIHPFRAGLPRRRRSSVWTAFALLPLLLAGCKQAPQVPVEAPRPASVSRAWVSAANPHAVDAGLDVLERGGSAIDAAIAVQAVLGLVEPQSSGIGGGAFVLYYDAGSRKVTAFDGRETAPAGADPRMFLDENGQPLPRGTATTSGRAVGVPGAMRMLEAAHRKYGRLPWNETFPFAIRLAEDGFKVSQRLTRYLGGQFPQANAPDVRALFSRPDGTPLQTGDHFRNPAYAQTLRKVAAEGADALHEGPIAEAIVARVTAQPLPGTMTLQDLAQYAPEESEPLCRTFRMRVICVPPPPSSGVALLQLLALLEQTDASERNAADPQAWFQFAQASRLMYADRDRYVADPRFVPVPVEQLLDPAYVAKRAKLIGERAAEAPGPGVLAGFVRAPDATEEAAGTSHFVIVDAHGNAVSMTTTVETFLGSGRIVGGFVLNNQMTDFSLDPTEGGRPAANAVAGGKRPRSSMAPVIVLDLQGRLVGALGSPGGTAILAYNAKTLLATLGWGMNLQQAIELPNLIARGNDFGGEAAKFAPGVLEGLAQRGVIVKPGRGEESGLHGLLISPAGEMQGGADPRREGVARSVSVSGSH